MLPTRDTEIENEKTSIPYLEVDSRLGWEYITTPERIDWKIKIMLYIMRGELKWYKDAIAHYLKD